MIKQLKNRLKSNRLILDLYKFIFSKRIQFIFHKKFLRSRAVAKEVKIIRKKKKLGLLSNVVMVWDNKLTPMTYGDFLYLVIIARLLNCIAERVVVLMSTSTRRADFKNRASETDYKKFVQNQKKILSIYLSSQGISVCYVQSRDNKDNVAEYIGKGDHIVFKKHVVGNKTSHLNNFSLIQELMEEVGKENIDNVLLSKNELNSIPRYYDNPYVVMNARYNRSWGQKRNTSAAEFISNFKILQGRFPKHDVIVVSDKEGCEYFKTVSDERLLPCKFSKDFDTEFLEDVSIMQNSSFYFQVDGGGMAAWTMFSKVPYEIKLLLITETMFSENKFHKWSTDKQLLLSRGQTSGGFDS